MRTQEHVLKIIKKHGRDWLFTAQNFNLPRPNVSRALQNLAKQGIIRRVLRGIYFYPRFSKVLGDYIDTPSFAALANVIAKKNNWHICPCGLEALNILHLSDQVPANIFRYSTGPTCEYKIGNRTLYFKHILPAIPKISDYNTVLVVIAIIQLKQENRLYDYNYMYKLANVFSPDRWCKIRKLASSSEIPEWIKKAISRIGAV